jgi:hypothetical protein
MKRSTADVTNNLGLINAEESATIIILSLRQGMWDVSFGLSPQDSAQTAWI